MHCAAVSKRHRFHVSTCLTVKILSSRWQTQITYVISLLPSPASANPTKGPLDSFADCLLSLRSAAGNYHTICAEVTYCHETQNCSSLCIQIPVNNQMNSTRYIAFWSTMKYVDKMWQVGEIYISDDVVNGTHHLVGCQSLLSPLGEPFFWLVNKFGTGWENNFVTIQSFPGYALLF